MMSNHLTVARLTYSGNPGMYITLSMKWPPALA